MQSPSPAAWYPGIGGGKAIANVLFGDVNPSAKLPVTFPKAEADLPQPALPGSSLKPEMRSFPGAPPGGPRFPRLPPFDIDYTAGLKVGYKWFDAENKQPLFAFGYGLSYTTFGYSGLKLGAREVTFTLQNTGRRTGAEVAQVYVGLPVEAKEPPKQEEASSGSYWWLWTTLAVVAVGGGVAGYILLRPKDEPPPMTSLGNYRF